MTEPAQHGSAAARLPHIEKALAEYPHISSERIDDLLRWFSKEASALDVALLASDDRLAEPSRKFREDHLDPIRGWDIFRGILFLAVIGLVILLIAWRAL